jgi:hypothetical protein
MKTFVSTGSVEKMHVALSNVTKIKKSKIKDNQAAVLTESLSNLPAASSITFNIVQHAFKHAPALGGKGIVSLLMLAAATPIFWSLLAEDKKDREDYKILKAILEAYDKTQDPNILKSTQLFVKLHGVPCEKNPDDFIISEVNLMHNDMPPHIAKLIKDVREKATNKNAKEGLNVKHLGLFLLIRSCTSEAKHTLNSFKYALYDVKTLFTKDFKRVWLRATYPIIEEDGKKVLSALNRQEDQTELCEKKSSELVSKFNTLQYDLKTNAKMRLGTGLGFIAASCFISLACLNTILASTAGDYTGALGYLGLSAFLSVPSLRVLSERQTELAEIDHDKTLRMLEILNPA